MPIITHEDEKALASLEVEVSKKFRGLSKSIAKIKKKETDLGLEYQSYTKDLKSYIQSLKDLGKQLEILGREKDSNITQSEVDEHKKRVTDSQDKVKMIEGYFDRIKDLAISKETLINTMVEYSDLMKAHSGIRRSIVDIGLKIEKRKNKMVAAGEISQLEDQLKDVQREFERSKKEIEKKWAQLEGERSEVNALWQAFKGSIDDFE